MGMEDRSVWDHIDDADSAFVGSRSIDVPLEWTTDAHANTKRSYYDLIKLGRAHFGRVSPPVTDQRGDRVIYVMVGAATGLSVQPPDVRNFQAAGEDVVTALMSSNGDEHAWDCFELASAVGIDQESILTVIADFPRSVERFAADAIAKDLEVQFVKRGFTGVGSRISSRHRAS